MKRYLRISAISAVMILSLAGCSTGEEGSTEEEKNAKSSQDATEDTATSEEIEWEIVYEEDFEQEPQQLLDNEWIHDDLTSGEDNQWHVDHMDDNGEYFDVRQGPEFQEKLDEMKLYRQQIPFGEDDWLTLELAARDFNTSNEQPEEAVQPFAEIVDDGTGNQVLTLNEPEYKGGILVRNTEELPQEYRIEYDLHNVNFGGRNAEGAIEYDGMYNGYTETEEELDGFPWTSGEDIKQANGFYYLGIMDYANPAPHNNAFIHNHRKVVFDSYSTEDLPYGQEKQICNTATGENYDYYSDESAHLPVYAGFTNAYHQNFFNENLLYPPMTVHSECGSVSQSDNIYSAFELDPAELDGDGHYHMAVERHEDRYVIEVTGKMFHDEKEQTYRYEQKFNDPENETIVWHYNQTEEEYDGEYNFTATSEGDYGSYEVEQWPADSAYPDFFVIGDPHLNYYEGDAVIDNLTFSIPK
ncbi:hypothetical protein [Pontibacillus litoralis]|uniref:Uncharacterized protein n=1 Tax=Pontibacillus litoralis JSM 072002 TaxID=1385512 RepID=A0A0A5G231_9BACI|nr:hypothetical protein [Pontibacillus litoralis]KGX86079.1 hypothetical protein N784_05825 [Pontibacillus litoralis JSM 072002]